MKPFNLEHAKAGAPVAIGKDDPIEILKWDYPIKTVGSMVMGLRHADTFPLVCIWDQDGNRFSGDGNQDLMMAPLGQCEGKDVYYGDRLQHKELEWYIVATQPSDFGSCKWPHPPRVYPVTHMSDTQSVTLTGPLASRTMIINAAIRHGIDHGYLVDPVELDRLSDIMGITAPTPAEFIDAACDAYKRVVNAGNDWMEYLREANENIAKQNKIITDMAAANSKLIKERAAAQTSSDERGRSLADIAKLVGMADGYAYRDVPYNVKIMLDAKQTAINERNNILIEIAKGCKLAEEGGHWLWAQVPAAVRMREVAIARHFFDLGVENKVAVHLFPEWITVELTKVK